MSAAPRDPAPTDQQLVDMVRFMARTCLEVERGFRPPGHLMRLMDPATAVTWRNAFPIDRLQDGPVTVADLGTPHLSRLTDQSVVATIVTRTQGERWGALTLQLHEDQGRWRISDIQRVLANGHYRAGRRVRTPTPTERPEPRRLQR